MDTRSQLTVTGSFEFCADLARELQLRHLKSYGTPYHSVDRITFDQRDVIQQPIPQAYCPICGAVSPAYGHRSNHIIKAHPSAGGSARSAVIGEAEATAIATNARQSNEANNAVLTENVRNMSDEELRKLIVVAMERLALAPK